MTANKRSKHIYDLKSSQVNFICIALDHSYSLKGFTGHMIMGQVIMTFIDLTLCLLDKS